jgi:aryl sulfotransferase
VSASRPIARSLEHQPKLSYDGSVSKAIEPKRSRVHVHDDSRRWDLFVPRTDDIVVTTPPKSGTTWMQGIVASMLWPRGDSPAPAFDLCPWLDLRLIPISELIGQLDHLPHRRIIKTHSPADCIPIFPSCRYLAVYRDPRDAFVSWANHRRTMREELIEALNADAASDGIEPWPPRWNGDLDELWGEWVDWGTPMEHLASWWPHRGKPYVLFVHYADLKQDLEGEMRRVAAFLDVDVPDDLWPAVVERCGIAEMRQAHETSMLAVAFEGGATSFFDQGASGRWQDLMPDHLVRSHEELAASQLAEDARHWMEHGSLASGWRP